MYGGNFPNEPTGLFGLAAKRVMAARFLVWDLLERKIQRRCQFRKLSLAMNDQFLEEAAAPRATSRCIHITI